MNSPYNVPKLLQEHYHLTCTDFKSLEGYDSTNFKVTTDKGTYLLKIYQPEPGIKELLDAENKILLLLNNELPGYFSNPIPNIRQELITTIQTNERETIFLRLLTFLEGSFFAESSPSTTLYYSLGQLLGKMDKALTGQYYSAVAGKDFDWDLKLYARNLQHASHIEDPKKRKWAEYFYLQQKEIVDPLLPSLRKSILHGDANDWNLLVNGDKVTGLIDFGDMCYSPLINELAIALTYLMLGKEEPLQWAIPVLTGYHEVLPLDEKEIDLLFYLIGTRLAVSVSKSAYTKTLKPDSGYITISEKPAWELLEKWVRMNPRQVSHEFRTAIGLPPTIVDNTDMLLSKRLKVASKALSISFDKPIHMVSAAFQYMHDDLGNTYLDAYNNIPHVGHCHPRVVQAGQQQMARLNTNTRYLSEVYNNYAEKLLSKFPAKLSKVFFVNSGSAASDLALRLAQTHSRKKGIVVMEHGYHGNTRQVIDISHYKYNRKGGQGKAEHILEATLPDTYKGQYTQNDGTAGKQYATDLVARIKASDLEIGTFISEPIVGCGGQVPLAKGYLKEMYAFIRANGGVCINDEVQTGFGRLGDNFWGFEMQQVVPDIVILGKPIANGHPMGAVVTTEDIAASFETGMEFFSSFGGNPVSCAIAHAVLDVLEEEQLPEHAQNIGSYILNGFEKLTEKYEWAGNARGQGLFLGLELVKDKVRKEPFTELAAFVKNKLKEQNILIGTDGPFDNTLKIKPPLCFSQANADELLQAIDQALSIWATD
jgi:ethanolamine-phosphate phospho-lyase